MNLKFYITIILAFVFTLANAQTNYYYYYKGEKVYLNLDKTSVNISVFKGFQKRSLNDLEVKDFYLKNDVSQNVSSTLKYAKINFQHEPSDSEYFQKINSMKNIPNIRTVYPSFIGKDGTKIGLSDYLYVKLKSITDYALLEKKAKEYGLSIIEENRFMPLWYTLRCSKKTSYTSLEIANNLFETGLFKSSIPDLLVDDLVLCANDTNFGDLWGLHNSSNPNGGEIVDAKTLIKE